jgi:hypothetical protein
VSGSCGRSGGSSGISIEDVFADPDVLVGKVPTDRDILYLINDAFSRGWQ